MSEDKMIAFMIAHLDEATDVSVNSYQRKAGLQITMETCHSTASFSLYGRKVSLEYTDRFPVEIRVPAAKGATRHVEGVGVVHTIQDGRQLMTALLERGDGPSVRQVFPDAFPEARPMTDGMEIDPHTYTLTNAPVIRCFPSPGGMVRDGTAVEDAVSATRHEFTIPVAIQPIARPPGYDWRAAQSRVPRNGKQKSQWSRRHA